MLAKRIIPCLDVKDGVVVKGVQFRNHVVMGDILDLAKRYSDEGADELVFYDITASSDGRIVSRDWVEKVARLINIPFCVAGGIRTIEDARRVLNNGADKISINSPALERPDFITELAEAFGAQCVVVGIDSCVENDGYVVYQYTGDEAKTIKSKRETVEWAREAQRLGAGEIVLNCMNQDGVRKGYDIKQLLAVRRALKIPLIASGGAGAPEHFVEVFREANVDGALAAGIFHEGVLGIPELKSILQKEGIMVRP
ncbi:MAG: imidazole glycerol phosphate synthase subunit HisF [Bdellovibrionales bacterium]